MRYRLYCFMYPIVAPYSLAQKKPNGERECEGVQNGYEKVNGTQTEWISNDIQRIQNGSKKKRKKSWILNGKTGNPMEWHDEKLHGFPSSL